MDKIIEKIKEKQFWILPLISASCISVVLAQRLSKKVSLPPKNPIKEAYKINKDVIQVGVDSRFYKQFKYILKICVPSWKDWTVGILVLHTIFLVLRTYLTVVVARIDGMLVKDLVAGQGRKFLRSLVVFMAIALPATYTNSMVLLKSYL